MTAKKHAYILRRLPNSCTYLAKTLGSVVYIENVAASRYPEIFLQIKSNYRYGSNTLLRLRRVQDQLQSSFDLNMSHWNAPMWGALVWIHPIKRDLAGAMILITRQFFPARTTERRKSRLLLTSHLAVMLRGCLLVDANWILNYVSTLKSPLSLRQDGWVGTWTKVTMQ